MLLPLLAVIFVRVANDCACVFRYVCMCVTHLHSQSLKILTFIPISTYGNTPTPINSAVIVFKEIHCNEKKKWSSSLSYALVTIYKTLEFMPIYTSVLNHPNYYFYFQL